MRFYALSFVKHLNQTWEMSVPETLLIPILVTDLLVLVPRQHPGEE